MQENYQIERILCKKRPKEKLANEMMLWGKIMGDLRMVPYVEEKGWAGNIGFRENDTIWVTPSGGIIDDIKPDDLMGITKKGNKIVFFGDKEKKPTSEWEIYWIIFKKRPDINVILHGHDLFALETAKKLTEEYPKEVALTTKVTEAGSSEFRDDMLEIVTDTNTYLVGKEHGFFALGKTFEEAGKLALEFRSRANELMIGKGKYKELLDKYHIG
jgi:L-fuculose-phosphate aldolase